MDKHDSNKLESVTEGDYPFGGVDQPSSYAKHTELMEGLENQTRMVEVGLVRMGLTPTEARIYVLLAKVGAKKASEVAKLLNLPRTETYFMLGSLQKKGLVSSTISHPVRFVAVDFDTALNTLLGMEKQRVTLFERQCKELLCAWSSIATHQVICEEIEEEKFQILEGNNAVYQRIKDVISSAEEEIIIMADQKQLTRLYHNEVTDNFKS